MLEKIETTMAAIRTKLLQDNKIKQLLYFDSNDALQCFVPEDAKLEKYITLRPIYEFENKEDYDQNSMINIYMTQASPYEDIVKVDGILQVNVICNVDIWELVDNKIRPLQIADRIITLVNNHKFTASNKLVLNTVTDLIVSKSMVGYALLFEITDGSGETDKF